MSARKSGSAPRVELELARMPALEQLEPARVQLSVELLDERDRLPGEDVLGGGRAHAAASRSNCASSVEPLSASVELSGETACATRSK